ncbi:hypothetical protein EMCG_04521 [[Emmonsia] crescens]|uniref:Uncharacterized protein n=1 Tax=[Emmonsia] crescens TaxID=73230 RepID=A0A0G2IYR6_9EURO|nr:hypothetical protein EMCG_04521 [Emmonsia crescens UAMH 3008]
MEPHRNLASGPNQIKLRHVRSSLVDRLREPKQISKRRSADANLNDNQPTAAPAIPLSQPIDIDEDPGTEFVLHKFLQEERKRKEQQKKDTWVNRTIKCCSCDGTSSTINRCGCGHKYCPTCFRYSDKLDMTTGEGGKIPDEDDNLWKISDFENDDLWKIVKKVYI